MENNSSKKTVRLSVIMCALGHDYMITNTITPYIKEYKCCNCGREMTNDLNGDLKVLTEKSRIVNACLASFFIKKTNHLNVAV